MDPDPNQQNQMADPNQIRAKRLAKLAAASSSPSSSPTHVSPSTSSYSPGSTSPAITKPVGETAGVKPMDVDLPAKPTPKISTAASPAAPPTPTLASSAKGTPTSVASVLKGLQTFAGTENADWENRNIEIILQVTLQPETAAQQPSFALLSTLAEELEQENLPRRLEGKQLADRAISARLFLPMPEPQKPLFDYLVGCWRRCGEARRKVTIVLERTNGVTDAALVEKVKECGRARLEAVDAVRDLVVNYAGLVVMPGMAECYPQAESISSLGPALIAEKLLKPPDEAESEIPQEFLSEFIRRYENEDLDQFIGPIMNTVSAHMLKQSLTGDYQTSIRVLRQLITYKQVATVITQLPNWNPPNMPPKVMEVATILGRFFSRPTIFPDTDPTIANSFFASANPFGDASMTLDNQDIGSRNPGDVRSTQNSIRQMTGTIQTNLHEIIMTIVKCGPEQRESVLSYFAAAIKANMGRGKMQVDRREVSTDGFMHNLLCVLLRMCEPIMDSQFSKLHLIDPHYFKHPACRIDVSDVTRLFGDKEGADSYAASWLKEQGSLPATSFVSDVFFLTLAAHHYGIMSTIRYYQSYSKDLEELRKHVERMKAEKEGGSWGPQAPMYEAMLKRFQTQLDTGIAVRLCMETGLLDVEAINQTLRFYSLVMMWMLRTLLVAVGSVQHPAAQRGDPNVNWVAFARGDLQGLPFGSLPSGVPKLFGTLPEWILEDICEFFLFVCRFKPTVFERNPRDEFLTFSMCLLNNASYVKNPYLKSKLVEILFYFTIPLYRTPSGQTLGKLDGVFTTHPLAKEWLVSSLLKFYVDVEQTGMSSQFYDKFNIRYNISQIVKGVWNDPNHRVKIIQASGNTELFVKFVNLLMNDTTYLLDESLSKLTEIRNVQNEMADEATWNAMPQQQRQEREGFFRQCERQAQSYMSLGVETVHMLRYLTSDERIVEPFMAPSIVPRLAAMLDFNLDALVGPRCTELKVKNPEKYRFNPKNLLNELIDVYMHLSHRTEFVSGVAKDGRSYKKELFARASGILLKNGLKNQGEVDLLYRFVDKVEAEIQAEADEEEELGDVPDEFLDPLMYSLMEDPVILPTSKVTMDRATITSHLLSDQRDPINRMPLTIDMVIPDTEMKARILAWKQSRKQAKTTGAGPMDTS
ncbi:ubiquitin elongating factor core-domain-containing protein [Cladochytrium replicatum]|nr:ubiquitin elongating factor core-domain-containing protein [Cladochytrium replicatum]